MRLAAHALGIDEAHRDGVGLARDIEGDLLAFQPHRAAALALHQPAIHLAGNLPLAFAKHVIDRSAHRGQPSRDLALRPPRRKPRWKFLRDEAGRKLALAPARVMHQGREERDVVTDAVDIECIERGRLRFDRGRARRRVGDELRDHRIVEDGNLAAFLHTGVVAHGDAVLVRLRRRAIFHEPSDRRQEIAERIFGVDARFHRPSAQANVFLRQR